MVEENSQFIELEIRRSFGTFGDIAVALSSISESATSPSGRPGTTSLYVLLLLYVYFVLR